jgi:hypothetical protein
VTGVPSQPRTFYMGVAAAGSSARRRGAAWTIAGRIPRVVGSIAVADSDPNIIVGTGAVFEPCPR